MADQDVNLPPADDGSGDPIVPFGREEEDEQARQARRAASAQFVVASEVGSEAAIREAMDPANQSLADALKLSFRVLQVVMLLLVVLFLFSGWKQVKADDTGVRTAWGRVVDAYGGGDQGLKFSPWPSPAGEFILFREAGRAVRIDDTFWPNLGPRTLEEAVQQASSNDRLRPGRDGSLLTAGADIAHLTVSAEYSAVDPVTFLELIDEPQADRLVRLVLQRAVVHVGASMSLDQVVDKDKVMAGEIERSAQRFLDAMAPAPWVSLDVVNLPSTSPALAIRKSLDSLHQVRISVDEQLERARKDEIETLTKAAGDRYREIVRLIARYEAAADAGDQDVAEAQLEAINTWLESGAPGGDVAQTISYAQSYESQVESTLGNETRYFESLLPRFRRKPEQLVKELWLERYAGVLQSPDAEVFYVPFDLAAIRLSMEGLTDVYQERTNRQLQKKEEDVYKSLFNPFGGFRRSRDHTLQGPGRRLNVTESGITSKQ